MRLLGFLGVVLVLLGAAMLLAPGVTRVALRVGLGVRWSAHPAARVAAWGLILLGLAVTLLARLVG